MENINLSSIKRESVKAIYNSIAGTDIISRAQISKQTGLSLMTVGKVVDALLNLNIIKQSKEVKSVAGRKAGLISTNNCNFCIILDLTSLDFSMVLINIRLEAADHICYTYNKSYHYEENLILFLKNVTLYLSRHVDMANCIGIGISLPGPYDADTDRVLVSRIPELTSVHIREIVFEIFETDSIFIEASVNVAALSNITSIDNYKEKTILYWFIGDYIAGTVIINGEIIHGAHNGAGNFGHTIVSCGKTLECAVKEPLKLEDAAYELSKALYNVIKILDPHVIILEYEIFKKDTTFISAVRKSLTESFCIPDAMIPEIITGGCKFRHAQRGLALRLRERWLDGVIK